MQNVIKGVTNKASQEIAEYTTRELLPPSIDLNQTKDIKYPDMQDLYKATSKELDNKKEEMVKRAMSAGSNFVEGIKSDLNDLGVNAGHLITGTAQFAARLAIFPASIISVCTIGVGVAPNLLMPLIQQLKSEGDNLSATYDKMNTSINKLGLKRIQGKVPSIAGLLAPVTAAMAVAKPLIKMVGASVNDESGDSVDIEPPIEINLSASDCSNFTYKNTSSGVSWSNCASFSPIIAQGQDGYEGSCNNCSRYNKKTE